MLLRDSQGRGLASVAAQAGLCTVLALVFVLGGDRAAGIERGYYDLWQRLTAAPATAPVVIVDPGDGSTALWERLELPALLGAARSAGARSILPAAAPPSPVRSIDRDRLSALIRLEERRGATGQATAGELHAQLAALDRSLEQQGRVGAAMAAAGNVMLGLGTSDRRPGVTGSEGACGERIAAADRGSVVGQALSRLDILPAPSVLCAAAGGIGHLGFPTDDDGVVRAAPPTLITSRGRVAAAARVASLTDPLPQGVESAGIALLRHYRALDGAPGIPVVNARTLLAGDASELLRDRYVIIGTIAERTASGIDAPTQAGTGLAMLVATDLANRLTDSHIHRPGWATLVELGLALIMAAGTVLAGRLSMGAAAATAVAATSGLLAAEYALLSLAGFWLKLAGLALFCLIGVALMSFMVQWQGTRAVAKTGRDQTPADQAGAPGEELDLAFSVLRQQPTTEKTKQQLYALAMQHGRHRDYARAERVFRHLAVRDPGYRDVASKLEKLSGARGAAPAPARPVRPTAPPEPQTAAVPPATVRTLGRYELERVIGRGAMATVYLGRDPTINRRVAIKTLPLAEEFAENDLATARSSFLREAESAGRLNHPEIISIHDAGEDQRVAYLAMEYFEGKPMSHYAQVGRLLPPHVVIEVMARAAEALHYAHSQNVVHRDVKPANLLYDAAHDRLKLTDFGIARLTDSSRTRTGIILGTPSYMSPEQLSASKVSGLSDLYSLGVTMYHLLTGSPPFQADSIPRLMDKIVNQRHRPVTDLRDDVPAGIDAVLDRAMAKNPADRYQSGKAMAMALRKCCSPFAAEVV